MDTHKYYRNFLEWNTSGQRLLPIFLNGDENVSIPGTYGLQQVIHNIFTDIKERRNAMVSIITPANFTVTGGEGTYKLNMAQTISVITEGNFLHYNTATYPPGADSLDDTSYDDRYLMIKETDGEAIIEAVVDYKTSDGVLLGKIASGGASFTIIVDKTYMRSSPDITQTILDTTAHEYFNPYVYYDNNLDLDVTGTANYNASSDTTFQWGGSTKMSILTGGMCIPDLVVNTTLLNEGTSIFDGTVNVKSALSMLGDTAVKQSITNVNDINSVTSTIGTATVTSAGITTVTSATNFTAQPTITLSSNQGDMLDTYRFPNVIYGDASNDGNVNFNIDLQGKYIYLKQPTANAQHSGIVIKRVKDSIASLPANGKMICIANDGDAEPTSDTGIPCIGIKIGDDGDQIMYILNNGYYRMDTTTIDYTSSIGKVLYKSTNGDFTIDPTSIQYAQAVASITNAGGTNPYWIEMFINTSNVIVDGGT